MDPYFRPYQTSTFFSANSSVLTEKNDSRFTNEVLREKLRKQLEYYFSRENLMNDLYLQSQMDAENYVPISLIANFKLIKRLTDDLQLIIDVLKESSSVEVHSDEKKVRPIDSKLPLPARKRCIIILRNVPLDATEQEIMALFLHSNCSVAAVSCERVLESDHSDCWYVTFNSEDDAQNAFLYLTRENVVIRDQKILARMKACLWQKTSSTPVEQTTQATLPVQQMINNPSRVYYPPTFPFPQQMNINFQQQTPFFNQHQPIFPTQFWYIPSANTDASYSPPMIVPLNSLIRTYNAPTALKTRPTTTSKPRPSNKSNSNSTEFSGNHTSHSEDKN